MDFRLPELGEGVYEAELLNWLVKAGDQVKRGQPLVEVLTDKATMEVPAPFTGTITRCQAAIGEQLKIGQVILSYIGAGQADEAPPAAAARAGDSPQTRKSEALQRKAAAATARSSNGPSGVEAQGEVPIKAAPSVRHLARKLGIDLARVRGTGPQGRILIGDLTPHLAGGDHFPRVANEQARSNYGIPGTRIQLQGLRRKIAEHMVLAKQTIPHYSYVDECDVTDMVRMRQSLKETYARAGVKITFLAFFVKAAAAALKEVPIVNSSLDDEAGEIILHDHYHIGIAVATSSGLIVPVIRDADRKDLGQIAADIERLSETARTGKIKLDDLRGGTFTVTSVGNIGGLISTPVINHPEVAILGIGKVVKRPAYDGTGNLKPADLVYLSFSFDHRVLDGAVGAAFGNAIIRRLQNPALLLLPDQAV